MVGHHWQSQRVAWRVEVVPCKVPCLGVNMCYRLDCIILGCTPGTRNPWLWRRRNKLVSNLRGTVVGRAGRIRPCHVTTNCITARCSGTCRRQQVQAPGQQLKDRIRVAPSSSELNLFSYQHYQWARRGLSKAVVLMAGLICQTVFVL